MKLPALKALDPGLRKKPKFERSVRTYIETYLARHHPEVHVVGFLMGLESAAYFAKIDVATEKTLPSEKDRQRAMARVRTASNNLAAALEELDEEAKWHYFGCVESGRDIGAMGVLDRRGAEGKGYKRGVHAKSLAKRLFEASTYPLPPLDRYPVHLQVAVAVRITLEGQGIDFTAQGFSRTCLDETFKLAGMPTSSIAYWVNRSKNEAKNLP